MGEFRHLFGIHHQWRTRFDVGGDLVRFARPAQQAFVFQPANAEEAIADRILNHPGRPAIGTCPGLVQAQILPQRLR